MKLILGIFWLIISNITLSSELNGSYVFNGILPMGGFSLKISNINQNVDENNIVTVFEDCDEEDLSVSTVIALDEMFLSSGYSGDSNYWCSITSISASSVHNITYHIGALKELKFLTLVDSQFDTLPSSMGSLINLNRIYIENTDLISIPSELMNINEIEQISIIKSKLSSLPSNIGDLKKLEVLNLAENNLTGALPESIGELVKLEILNLYNNYISDIPTTINGMTKLEYLNLSLNNINSIPNEINQMKKLEYLYLDNNPGTFENVNCNKIDKVCILN